MNFEEISELSKKALQKYGYTMKEATEITKHLLWAEKRGSSQGFTKLFGWRIEKLKNAKSPIIEKSTLGMIHINANQHSHILACDLGINELLNQLKRTHSCILGVKNAVNSAGALGYYTEQIANAGYIAIMMSAADPGIAPYGGNQAVYGTNPISISIPALPNPIILDMSIANFTWGDLLKLQNENKLLPENSAYDENGNETQDPKLAMDGCVKTFNSGYKGSGLALMIQILAGPLVGSLYSTKHEDCQYGSLIIAINPEFFGDKNLFLENINKMISEIKATRTANGFTEILMPSESSYAKARASEKNNSVYISDKLLDRINHHINN